jgi:hypothetical protein
VVVKEAASKRLEVLGNGVDGYSELGDLGRGRQLKEAG